MLIISYNPADVPPFFCAYFFNFYTPRGQKKIDLHNSKKKTKKKKNNKVDSRLCFVLQKKKKIFLILTSTLSEPDVKILRARSDNMLVNGRNVESKNGKVNEFSENIETIREILRHHHGDNQLQVTDIQCGPGSKDGDNYMSLIKRINVKIKANKSAGE